LVRGNPGPIAESITGTVGLDDHNALQVEQARISIDYGISAPNNALSSFTGDEDNFCSTFESLYDYFPRSSVQNDTVETFQCPECHESFSMKHQLNTHLKKHTLPFKCSDCDASFRYKKDLSRHCASKHQSEGSVAKLFCPYDGCKYGIELGQGFTRKDNLNRHIKSRHESVLVC